MAHWSLNSLGWRLFPAVRHSERERFVFFSSLYAGITMAQTLGLVGSEALFLAHVGPGRLPEAFLWASVTSVGGTFLYAALVGHIRNDRLFISMLVGTALLLGISVGGLALGVPWLFFALFCAFYLTQAIFITHFRTFATDFFDTLASKRMFPAFAVGASAGGAAGGGLAVLLVRLTGAESLIAAWAALLLAAAALLALARGRLRRWGPLELEESDESSVEGLEGAFRFLRRSSLSRWLVISVVGMVVSLSLIHFLSSKVFVDTFPSATSLAAFLGLYLGISNGLEIVLELTVTPWLIRRYGVSQSNLVHPALTVLSFVWLIVDPRFLVALVARTNRELIENAIAGEVRNLSYNALPYRFRGSMRALLEGMVFYAAMSAAGLVLLLLGDGVEFRTLCVLGLGTALLYLAANWRVRSEYIRSLVFELRRGRLDLEGIRSELGATEVAQLAEPWERMVTAKDEQPSQLVLSLAPLLASHGQLRALENAARESHPKVRAAAIAALASRPTARLPSLLRRALRDPDPDLRHAAARAVGSLGETEDSVRDALRICREDCDSRVRAEAALRLGSEGRDTLQAMARGADPDAAVAALERLPSELRHEVSARLEDEEPRVRAAALRCATRLALTSALPRDRLLSDLRHSDAEVRCAAVEGLAASRVDGAAEALAEALDDPSRLVREKGARELATMGDPGIEAAARHLASARVWTVDAALRTLAMASTARSRSLLEAAFRQRVRQAWWSLVALERVPTRNRLEQRFLRSALDNARARNQWLALRILELSEEAAVVRSVRRALSSGTPRARSNALEVLSHLGERESAGLLALILEEGPLSDRLGQAPAAVYAPRGFDEVLRAARRSEDPWLRMAARNYESMAAGKPPREAVTMNSLLALQEVPIFKQLSLEQLEALHQQMEEIQYLRGEVLVREGDPGNQLFVLLEGELEVYKSFGTGAEIRLNTLSPVSYTGEIAVLDNAPRSATLVASRDSRLLALDGDHFKDLVRQEPEICFEIFRFLTARIRAAEARTVA